MGSAHCGLYQTPFDLPRALPPVCSLDDLITLPREDRIAYVQRIRVPHAKFRGVMEECEAIHGLSRKVDRPGCLVIYGHSRSGKTTLCEEFAAARPPIREPYAKDRVRVLTVTAPPFPTVKGLAEQFLWALGDPHWYRGTLAQMRRRILKLLNECEVEIVFLDETQNFVDMTGLVTEFAVTIFLMQLIDEVNVPFVALGLERCCNMFRGNEMLRGRFKTHVQLGQYDFDRSEDQREWMRFIEGFAHKLPVKYMPDFSNAKLARKMWYASLGLPGHAANIFAEATDIVIRKTDTKDTLTMGVLSTAFRRTAWQEMTELANPFESDSDVEKEKLPPIKTDYTAFIEDRTYWKHVRDARIGLTSALKKRSAV